MARLRDLPIQAPPGESVIAPVEIDGLAPVIEALGRRWQRKVEFHMTVLAASVIVELGEGHPESWKIIGVVLGGRRVGPIYTTREVRRVRHPDKPQLETIVVMVDCPELGGLFGELSSALDARLVPPPAHVTLYSTDPEQGIGISDAEQLRERAPELSEAEQEEVRRAMGFDVLFCVET